MMNLLTCWAGLVCAEQFEVEPYQALDRAGNKKFGRQNTQVMGALVMWHNRSQGHTAMSVRAHSPTYSQIVNDPDNNFQAMSACIEHQAGCAFSTHYI